MSRSFARMFVDDHVVFVFSAEFLLKCVLLAIPRHTFKQYFFCFVRIVQES